MSKRNYLFRDNSMILKKQERLVRVSLRKKSMKKKPRSNNLLS
jgi:hypothetical protein